MTDGCSNANGGWVTASVIEKCFICFLGALGNGVTLWCLITCRRMGVAVKLHLCIIFALMLLICTVTLPGVAYVNYVAFFCQDEHVPRSLKLFFSIGNVTLLQVERISLTAVALTRMVAVWRPDFYKRIVTVVGVIIAEIVIVIYTLFPWMLALSQNFKISKYNGRQMAVNFGSETSATNTFIYTLYGVNYCLPFLLSLAAYIIMRILMTRQRRKLTDHSEDTTTNHITFTISVVLLAHLVMDGPHVIVHQIQDFKLGSIITHMIFYLHLLLDPIIFVTLNRHYRRKCQRMLWEWTPRFCADRFLSPPTVSELTIKHQQRNNLSKTSDTKEGTPKVSHKTDA